MARKIHDRRGEMAALNNLGLAYKASSDPRNAIACEQQALSSAQQLQDQQVEGQVLKSLGNAYYAPGEHEQAIGYYKQRLTLAQHLHDRHLEAQALRNLGNAFMLWTITKTRFSTANNGFFWLKTFTICEPKSKHWEV
jgi:tetratricopeptide (TPR) repeat protein